MKTSFKIGFSRSNGRFPIYSTLIRIAEKRPYSHAYVRMDDRYTGRDVIFQASSTMVNRCNIDIFRAHNRIIKEYVIDCTEEEFKEIWTWLSDKLGLDYSRTQIMWISIKKLLRISGKSDNGDREFICSELAAKALRIKGISLPRRTDEITPSDLDKILEGLGFRLA